MTGRATALDSVVGSLILLVGVVSYFAVLEGGPSGQTLGKQLLGIKVVDLIGSCDVGVDAGSPRDGMSCRAADVLIAA